MYSDITAVSLGTVSLRFRPPWREQVEGDAGLELELAIAQDRCAIRWPSCWGAWNGGAGSVSSRSLRCGRRRRRREPICRRSRAGTGWSLPGIQVAPLGRTRGIGVPGASELPSFVSVEITKDAPSLPAVVPVSKPAVVDDAPRRRRRKKSGLIEIELANVRVRVDRDVDAAALERVLDVLARR